MIEHIMRLSPVMNPGRDSSITPTNDSEVCRVFHVKCLSATLTTNDNDKKSGKRMTIAMGETHTHTHIQAQIYSWECKIQKRIQMEMKTMLEAKTNRKLATMTKWKQQTIVGVCVCVRYMPYDIQYTIHTRVRG